MAERTALQYVKLFERESNTDQNFKTNLWQPAADLIHPRMNQITKLTEQGSNKTEDIFNTKGMTSAEDASSGLSGMMIPNGQEFFSVKVPEKSRANNRITRYLSFLSQRSHELIFASNYISEFNEALLSMIVFGPCNLYSEYLLEEDSLNYQNYDIGSYTVCLDSRQKLVAIIVKWQIPANEAVKTFKDRAGKLVTAAASKVDTENERFDFIHIVEPREKYNTQYASLSGQMPFSSVWVNIKDIVISKEAGFLHNPYHHANWRKAQTEKWGRGRGTMALPAVRQLQQMELDLTECGNKHNNPALEVLESFDGTVDVRPGAQNRSTEQNSIRRMNAEGNFPISKDQIERKELEVEDMFMMKIFRQFLDLSGDRRTTTEIQERKNQALRLVGAPIMNVYNQLIAPSINRSILLLIRNGKIIFEGSPNPPDELSGSDFGLEFQGELALALRDQQSRGFMNFAGFLGEMNATFPNEYVGDYISLQRSIPRMGRSFGVNIDDLSTDDEIQEKRAVRAAKIEEQKQMQLTQMAAAGYKDTTKAPEQGSAAEKVIEQTG